MKIYNELESLGFFEWLDKTHNLKDTDINPEYLDKLPLNAIHRSVANSMVFRWFRDKHKKFSYIDKNAYGKYYYDIQGEIFFDEDYFKTYEEAELACLRKLIEIIKEK